jgi:hypothetical protein
MTSYCVKDCDLGVVTYDRNPSPWLQAYRECERDLRRLEADGYSLDVPVEASRMARLPRERRVDHLEHLRKVLRRDAPADRQPAPMTAQAATAAVLYASEHNCPWSEAVEKTAGDPVAYESLDDRSRPVIQTRNPWTMTPKVYGGDDGGRSARYSQALSKALLCPHYKFEWVLAACLRGIWDRPADIGETRQILALQDADPARRTWDEALAELRGFDPDHPNDGPAVPMPAAAVAGRAPTEPWLVGTVNPIGQAR